MPDVTGDPWPETGPPPGPEPDEADLWPHDVDAERWLLGSMMRRPANAEAVIDGTGWHPADMYRPQHQEIAAALVAMWAAGEDIDPQTLRAWMGDAVFRGAFTPVYLADLWELGASVPGALRSAERVHDLAIRRRAIEAAIRLRQLAANPENPVTEVLGIHDRAMAAVTGELDVADLAVDPRVLAADHQAVAYRWVVPGLLDAGDRVIVVAGEGAGKALAADTPVPTPKGWTTMGDLTAGDQVFAPDGTPADVVATSGIMLGRPCYRIRFSDDAEIIADAGHLWATETARARDRRRGPAVVTTREMAATLHARGGHQLNHAIATCAPLRYPDQALPVPPYTLGAWLGDGTSRDAEITSDDPEIIDEIRRDGYLVTPSKSRPLGWLIQHPPRQAPDCLLAGHGKCARGYLARRLCHNHYERERAAGRLDRWPLAGPPPSLPDDLRLIGVLNSKHIPRAYLHASPDQRLALLQGLMDTDGSVSGGGWDRGRGKAAARCEFSVTDERLARDTHELLLGLGIKAAWREGPAVLDGRQVGMRYRLGFQTDLPVFRLPRKAGRLSPLRTRRARLRYVAACDPVPSVPVACIRVGRADGMFLAGRECIPTHNSLLGYQFAMAIAAGVHPLATGQRIDPQRTLVVDLEVSRGILARRSRDLLVHADRAGLDSSLVRVWSRPAGLDLRTADGQMALTQVVNRHRPAFVSLGPLYKAGLTEAEGPAEFKIVTDYLDRLRERYGCALWLEQHAPMRQGARARELRPIGSVIWHQWPEFGFALKPTKAEGRYDWARFRKDRETGRAWPSQVYWQTGFGWPWVAEWPAGAWDSPLLTAADEIAAAQAEAEDRRDELAARRMQHHDGNP